MSRRKAKPKNKSRGASEGYVLDQFSQANLQQWNKLSSSLDEYHIRLFYHLEGSDSFVELVDDAPATVKYRRLDATSWKELSSI